MVLITLNENMKDCYLDAGLVSALEQMKKLLNRDWDMMIIVDGQEGAGKSKFARQIAAYLTEGNFSIKDIVFTTKEYKQRVKEKTEVDKKTVIVFDEAFKGLSSRGAMTNENKKMVQTFQESRFKNLYHIIVLPSFFDLDKYAAIWRSRILFNVYADLKGERGFWKAYGKTKKKNLYILGKKNYNYACVRPQFFGRFVNKWDSVDYNEYTNKKYKSFQENNKDEEDRGLTNVDKRRDMSMSRAMFYEYYHEGKTLEQIGLKFAYSGTQVGEFIKAYKNSSEELNQKISKMDKTNLVCAGVLDSSILKESLGGEVDDKKRRSDINRANGAKGVARKLELGIFTGRPKKSKMKPIDPMALLSLVKAGGQEDGSKTIL